MLELLFTIQFLVNRAPQPELLSARPDTTVALYQCWPGGPIEIDRKNCFPTIAS